MSANPRRTFLRQLISLPLIGGGVTLIGQPTAVAEPTTFDLMQSYKTWLHYEHRSIAWELADHPRMVAYYGGRRERRYEVIEPTIMHQGARRSAGFHRYDGSSPASSRAALVLSAVGCDWREKDEGR